MMDTLKLCAEVKLLGVDAAVLWDTRTNCEEWSAQVRRGFFTARVWAFRWRKSGKPDDYYDSPPAFYWSLDLGWEADVDDDRTSLGRTGEEVSLEEAVAKVNKLAKEICQDALAIAALEG